MKRVTLTAMITWLCLVASSLGQSLTLAVPSAARAGTVVEVLADADGVSPKLPIEWTLPDVTLPADGDVPPLAFRDSVQVLDNGRRLVFAWPRPGSYELTAEAFVAIKDGDDVIGFKRLKAVAVLKLAGAIAGPEEAIILPPVPAEYAQWVDPVRVELRANPADAAELCRVWSQLAVVFERGGGKTTGAARQAHIDAAKYTTYGALAGKYPAARNAIDKGTLSVIGSDNVPLDTTKRAALVSFFRALAKAAQEASQ